MSKKASAKGKTSSAGSTKKNIPSDDKITREYNDRRALYKSLGEEVQFILEQAIGESGIKIHDVTTRVKALDSAIRKIRDKEYDSIDRVGDLLGGRIVCLFRGDLESLKKIVEESFQVDEFDDKSYSDPDAFGYMSLHFQCRLKQTHSGPRYDAIKGISFEIQLRTICMHAWSAVQHALDYKGEWDVPEHLKKDINALSALFYVADTEFAAVYKAREESIRRVEETTEVSARDTHPIDLDTIRAYAAEQFPGREFGGTGAFSKLVQELTESGYSTIGEVHRDVERAKDALALNEKRREGGPYMSVGALRISLGLASPEFRQVVYNLSSFSKDELALVKGA
jgi:ppGpp synthetase/RelA/SpoT-type nucleotidyltranferase